MGYGGWPHKILFPESYLNLVLGSRVKQSLLLFQRKTIRKSYFKIWRNIKCQYYNNRESMTWQEQSWEWIGPKLSSSSLKSKAKPKGLGLTLWSLGLNQPFKKGGQMKKVKMPFSCPKLFSAPLTLPSPWIIPLCLSSSYHERTHVHVWFRPQQVSSRDYLHCLGIHWAMGLFLNYALQLWGNRPHIKHRHRHRLL